MRQLLAALLLGTAPAVAADPVLVIPTGNGAARLQLEVTVNGKAPEVGWAAFLDRLFDHFDRDADGLLSAAEADRVFPLPLAGGRVARLDFAKLDEKGTRAAFKNYFREVGFTPVVVLVEPAPTELLALGAALVQALDRDRDGKLSAVELRDAPALLRRFDENEDEVLSGSELLATATGDKLLPAGLKVLPPDDAKSDAVLRLPVGGRPTLDTQLVDFKLSESRLVVPGGTCAIVPMPTDSIASLRSAKAFYLAQFRALAGDKPATKATLDDDPTAQVLANVFDAADRNGDAKLTRVELEAFFDLIESGVACRVVVTVIDRGRNLFDRFDTNDDGRLDLAELTRGAASPLDTIPASYRLSVGLGSVGESFGQVPLGTVATPKPAAKSALTGPRWFQAMDRNADGHVSANEFLGSPEVFTRLDTDRDGRISSAEAAAGK